MDPELIIEAVFRLMWEFRPIDVVSLTNEVKKVCEHRGIKQDKVAEHIVSLFDKYGVSKTY